MRSRLRTILLPLLTAFSIGTAAQYTGDTAALQPDTLSATIAAECALPCDSIADSLSVDSLPTLPWPLSLKAEIDTIVSKSPFLDTSQLGMLVYDLTADSALYARGERLTLRPASTMKVLTAVTALDQLGSAYLYKTRLCHTGTVTDSTRTLNGDIYVIGGMDPKLGYDDLRSFVMAIKELGVDTIRGNLYADRTMKDADLLGEGWCWDDDNPVLSPLVYNGKDNMIERLYRAFDRVGIHLDGDTLSGRCLATAQELCVRTHTIGQILLPMMKDSDNLYAESMLYQLGHAKGRTATAKNSLAPIKALMRKMGVSDSPHRLADGSGLSLYNYVSAEILVAFLRYAYNNPDIYTYLKPAMPIAGVDGTLEKRMRRTAAKGNVHAKTGTLTGISSLAGYCTASNGHDICFAIINQGIMRSAPAKAFQDKVCVAMTR